MDTTEGNQVGKIKPRHTIGWQKPISYLNAQRAKEMVSIDGLFSTFAAEGKHFISSRIFRNFPSVLTLPWDRPRPHFLISFLIMGY